MNHKTITILSIIVGCIVTALMLIFIIPMALIIALRDVVWGEPLQARAALEEK
jgi:hypothetical protein